MPSTAAYAYVPPNYYLDGTRPDELGGAFGFNTETSPGAAPLTLESLQATVQPSSVWPIGDEWDFHCGNPAGLFYDLRFFTPALDARFGASSSAKEYLAKAQVAAYDAHRAMFEGYSLMKYNQSTGVVQWMLNSAWPSNIWCAVACGAVFFYRLCDSDGDCGVGVTQAPVRPLSDCRGVGVGRPQGAGQ